MFENPRRGGQARNFATNVPKILDLKSSSKQIFSEIDVGCPCSFCPQGGLCASSETQGQIVGTRESLNGPKNIYGKKREEPLGKMSYQTSSKRSPPFWLLIGARKTHGKTLSPGALLALLYFSSFHIYFSARLDFPSPPLSAPGSPRMASAERLNCLIFLR